jgi:hypothetical protein
MKTPQLRPFWIVILLALMPVGCSSFLPIPPDPLKNRPGSADKIIIFALEGITTEDIDKLPLKNLQALKKRAISFPKASIGHSAPIPPVSSLVSLTGLHPKNLPASDYIYRDFEGRLGRRNDLFLVSALKPKLRTKLFAKSLPSFLQTIRELGKGQVFFSGSSALYESLRGKELGARLLPPLSTSTALSDLLKETESTRAALKDTLSGKKLLEQQELLNWKGIVVAAESKASPQLMDEIIGDTLKYLEEKDLLKSTLVLVYSYSSPAIPSNFQGVIPNPVPPVTGNGANFRKTDLPPSLKILSQIKEFQAAVFDGSLRIWISSQDPTVLGKVSASLRDLPFTNEIYTLHRTGKSAHYVRSYRNPKMPAADLDTRQKIPTLLETMASLSAADIVVLPPPGVSFGSSSKEYGVIPETIPIPVLLWAPNLKILPTTSEPNPKIERDLPVSLVDLHPMLRELLVRDPLELDGSSFSIRDIRVE